MKAIYRLEEEITIKHATRESFLNQGFCEILDHAKLLIDSSNHSQAIENHATLDIAGLLELKNFSTDSIFTRAVANYDSIFIDTAGYVYLYNIGGDAINNRDIGNIRTKGNLNIVNATGYGINNSGVFIVESGNVRIDSTRNGIINSDSMVVNQNGSIELVSPRTDDYDKLYDC